MEELLDRAAIEDVLYRYATAVDACDWRLLAAVFTPEAAVRLGDAVVHGPEALAARFASYVPALTACQHIVTNPVIELDGDAAASRSYLHAVLYLLGVRTGDTTLERGGTYHDRWVRTADGWRIAERRFELTWTAGNVGVELQARAAS